MTSDSASVSVSFNAEKSPFIPTLKDEALLQELNAKKELKSEQDEQDLSEKKSQVDIQKSYSFNEDRVKIFIGWQSLSGRSYSRYFLTTTVLFFGKYGARLGHIDQYTNKLSLARIENHQSNNNTTTTTNSNTNNKKNAILSDPPLSPLHPSWAAHRHLHSLASVNRPFQGHHIYFS